MIPRSRRGPAGGPNTAAGAGSDTVAALCMPGTARRASTESLSRAELLVTCKFRSRNGSLAAASESKATMSRGSYHESAGSELRGGSESVRRPGRADGHRDAAAITSVTITVAGPGG